MKLQVLNRKVHYWASAVIALPVLAIIGTGLLLQVKKQVPWVQPPEQRGKGQAPAVSLPQVLEACQSVPEAGIRGWEDVDRVDVRPARGMLKVTAHNRWEVQLDAQTGKVLQVAYRRSDLIESIHDGSWFHDGVKLWVFLPTGATLLLMWATGMYLFFLPIVVRRRRGRAPAKAAVATVHGSR
jgi:hypothetical protein